jgi:hypothetical protein
MDIINEWMKNNRDFCLAKEIECNDGLTLSVQASKRHYSTPKQDNAFPYSAVEIGFPSKKIKEILQYANDKKRPKQTLYGWVPIQTVIEVVEKHGGIKESLHSSRTEEEK